MLLKTPIILQSIIAGVVLVATMFAVALYLPRLSQQKKVKSSALLLPDGFEIYPTRRSLTTECGDLRELLHKSGATTAWASMNVGRHTRASKLFKAPLWKNPPLDKLILINPDDKCKYVQIYAEKVECIDTNSVKREIELTIQDAKNAGVRVYLFDAPISDGLVIAFQSSITESDIQGDNLTHEAWNRINQKEAWAKVDLSLIHI